MAKLITLDLVDPPHQTFGFDDYNVQNMLERQFNFPAQFYHGQDEYHREWDDRRYTEWRAAVEKFGKWRELDDEKFLQFCCMVNGVDPKKKATGCRIVRYTNVSSGYPTYAIDVFIQSDAHKPLPLYSDSYSAPNVSRPKRRRGINSINGIEYFDDGKTVTMNDEEI